MAMPFAWEGTEAILGVYGTDREDEVTKGVASRKRLETGEQREVALGELAAAIERG